MLRSHTLQQSGSRFIACTGTAGKTLARSAIAYALRKTGVSVIAPEYGYTNELGIVLAALGIEEPIHLCSFAGMQRVLTAQPVHDTYICIELGADWRTDIPWFLRHFRPFGICLTDLSEEEWALPLARIVADKRALIESVDPSGFVCMSTKNPSRHTLAPLVERASCTRIRFSISYREEGAVYESDTGSYAFMSLYREPAHLDAYGFAVACLEALGKTGEVTTGFFDSYVIPEGRLTQMTLTSGAICIADTYKAVPYCTERVLAYAIEQHASRRTLVLSALHPAPGIAHYERLLPLLERFDAVYLVGPRTELEVLEEARGYQAYLETVVYASFTARMAQELVPGTQLVIKGADRYKLGTLVRLLSGN